MTVVPTQIQSSRGHHRRPLVLAAILVLLIALTVALLFHYDAFQGSSTSTGVQGSGRAATQTRDVRSFTSIELAGSNNVAIRVGKQQSVVVRADDNLLDRVTTRVEAGNLVIGNTPGSFTTKSPMSVRITVPSLTAFTLSGSGNGSVTGIQGRNVTVTLSGSGVATAEGTATRLHATLSGSGDLRLGSLVAEDVVAVISGSGDIYLTARNSLDASVPGSGAILYGGNPRKLATSITGSGEISRL